MLYLVGGAPRAGKTILSQRVSANLKVGWVSTDVLMQMLMVKNEVGIKAEWNAAPAAITANAEWFFPYLERFIWGISSLADNYVIEGVDFLPAQIVQLSAEYQIRAVFLGCSTMTLDRLDRFPGRSHGYSHLPEEARQQIVQDVPQWSAVIRQEAERFGYPYIDMVSQFPERLHAAEALLTSDV
jgi:hypothetical protein